jgi:hypothetical protein
MPDTFAAAFNGTLYSLLSWEQLNTFWQRIDPTVGWYLYAIGEPAPTAPAPAEEVGRFVQEIDILLRREHAEEYCGIVFADNLENPALVKIYDPHHLGTSCGSSKTPPLPGWVMSRTPPVELESTGVVPASRKRWWNALFGKTTLT